MACKCGANSYPEHVQRIADGYPDHLKIDQVRCFGCGAMFDPWTNEWYCSDACHDAAMRAERAIHCDPDPRDLDSAR